MSAPAVTVPLAGIGELHRRVLFALADNDASNAEHGLSTTQIGWAGADAPLRLVGDAVTLLREAGLVRRYRPRNDAVRRHRLTPAGRDVVRLLRAAPAERADHG